MMIDASHLYLAYLTPDQSMPVVSVMAGLLGVALGFGHRILGLFRRWRGRDR